MISRARAFHAFALDKGSNGGDGGSNDGASARRTLRGITERKILFGKCPCQALASRRRIICCGYHTSEHGSSTSTSDANFSFTRCTVSKSCPRPFERVILRLHRNQNFIRRNDAIERYESSGWRRVDQNIIVVV